MTDNKEKQREALELAIAQEKFAILLEERTQATTSTAKSLLEFKEELRKVQDRALEDEENFLYFLDTDITDKSARKLIKKLNAWKRASPEEITIVINSLGGDCGSGFAIVDTILELRSAGINVNGVVRGTAQSMAATILQSVSTRSIGPNSCIMLHEGSLSSWGTPGQVNDHLSLMSLFMDRALDLLAERSTLPRAEIKKRWERRDWYLNAKEAKKFGFVDRIG
jgi:hypothetical protein